MIGRFSAAFSFSPPIITGCEIQHVGAVGHRGAQRLAQVAERFNKTQRAINLLLVLVEELIDVGGFPAPAQQLVDPAICRWRANQRQIKKMLDARCPRCLAEAMVGDTDTIVDRSR